MAINKSNLMTGVINSVYPTRMNPNTYLAYVSPIFSYLVKFLNKLVAQWSRTRLVIRRSQIRIPLIIIRKFERNSIYKVKLGPISLYPYKSNTHYNNKLYSYN